MNLSRSEQCICKICNCGRHRCKLHPSRPIRSGSGGGPCSYSEYTQQFTQHPIQPVGSFKPAAKPAQSEGPLSDKTTNRADFVPHPLERPSLRQAEQYRPPSGSFEGTTMYKKEFTEKRGDRAQPVKREAKRGGVAGEFRGEPTYKSDYQRWQLQKPERPGPAGPQWEPSRDRFGGTPTYQSDYVAYAARPPASFKPSEAAKMSQEPLEDVTDYRQSYVPHQLEPRQQPKERQAGLGKPAAPFEGVTTFARDFTPKAGGLRASMKPSAQAYASEAPFSDDTTHKQDFKRWQLDRPFVRQAQAYAPPEGAMDGSTTYEKDYPVHPIVRETYKKRQDRGRPSGRFESATDYKDNYRTWEVSGRVPAGPNQQYQPNTVPFEGQSTTASHFVPHQLDVRRSFKPAAGAANSEGPFDGTTLYRMEYVAKHAEPCPAVLLQSGQSGYQYQGSDERGHQVYVAKATGTPPDEGTATTVRDLRSGQLVSVK